MDDTFCIMPWKALKIESDGHVKVCCGASERLLVDGTEASVLDHSLSEIWNCQSLEGLRSKTLRGEWASMCDRCRDQEEHGIPSLRQQFNNGLIPLKRADIEIFRKSLPTDPARAMEYAGTGPMAIDIDAGNLCNLRCRMCHPDFSSQVARDPVHSAWQGRASIDLNEIRTKDDAGWYRDWELIERRVLSSPENLRFLMIMGGEPLLMDSLHDLLEKLKSFGYAENIAIHLSINGTTATTKWLDLLSQFKALSIAISIDGVEDTYEYIRAPAKWQTLLENIPKFLSLKNATVTSAPTIQAYNALELAKMYRVFNRIGLAPGTFFNVLEYPAWLSTRVLPPKARRLAAERLRHYAMNDCPVQSRIGVLGVANGLESLGDEYDHELVRQFMLLTNDLDTSRDQSFEDTHPELFSMIRDTGFEWTDETRFATT